MKFKDLQTWKKTWVGLFVLLMFLNANITAINSGPCAVSACGGESDVFSDLLRGDGGVEPSVYIHTQSNPLLSPTTLLLMLVPYESVASVSGTPMLLRVGFDNNPDTEIDRATDEKWAGWMYLAVKLIVLASFPLWWLAGLWCAKRRAAMIAATVILLGLSLFSVTELFVVESMGVTTYTWSLLL